MQAQLNRSTYLKTAPMDQVFSYGRDELLIDDG